MLNFGEKPEIINNIKNNEYKVIQNFYIFEVIIDKKEDDKIDEVSNYNKINQKKKNEKNNLKKGGLL